MCQNQSMLNLPTITEIVVLSCIVFVYLSFSFIYSDALLLDTYNFLLRLGIVIFISIKWFNLPFNFYIERYIIRLKD